MMTKGLACMVVLLSASVSSAWQPSDFAKRTTPKAGATDALYYRLWSPVGYSATAATKYPLVIFLHGSGERGNQGENDLQLKDNGQYTFLSTANQAAYPIFYAIPQATWLGWSDVQLDHVVAMVDELAAEFKIDTDRIYVTGISMGGAGTWSIIHRNPNLFAAAVPQSGWGTGGDAAPLASLPLWDFHAANDTTVPVGGSRDAINWLRGVGGDPIYTEFATGNHGGTWPAAYAMPALIPWIMAQHHGQARASDPRLDITMPTTNRLYVSGSTSLNLSGTASTSATSVAWYSGAATGAATGTSAWSASATGLGTGTPWVRVQASEPSGSALNGTTTYSDSLRVTTSATSDATPPTISIQLPTTSATYTASGATVMLSGTAADNKAVSKVRWTSNRGSVGDATGTTAWSIASIAVHPGVNVITVTAVDSSGLETSATLTVLSQGTQPPPDMAMQPKDMAHTPIDFSGVDLTGVDLADPITPPTDDLGTVATDDAGVTDDAGAEPKAAAQGCACNVTSNQPPITSLFLVAAVALLLRRRRA